MDMDGWRDILHFDFHGEHVLFHSLRLSSTFNFIVASLLTIMLCSLEKYLSYTLSNPKANVPSPHRSRLANAIQRAGVYWLLTLIRLLYMLLAMTFHVGLILVVVTTLACGQFIIEYLDADPRGALKSSSHVEGLPLLRRTSNSNSTEDLILPSSADITALAGNAIHSDGKRSSNRPRNSHHHIADSAINGEGAVIFATDA